MEAPFFVKSFLSCLLRFVKVDNCPSLVSSSVVAIYSNWMSFFILVSFYLENLFALPVDELLTFILEDLEPSRVGAPDLHVVGSSSTLDVP